jgi:hypothetical protein
MDKVEFYQLTDLAADRRAVDFQSRGQLRYPDWLGLSDPGEQDEEMRPDGNTGHSGEQMEKALPTSLPGESCQGGAELVDEIVAGIIKLTVTSPGIRTRASGAHEAPWLRAPEVGMKLGGMERNEVAAAVEEVAHLLRGDGADLVLLEADPKTARIEVLLELDDASCGECVLPTELLDEIIGSALAGRIREEFELVLHDPRRKSPSPGTVEHSPQ